MTDPINQNRVDPMKLGKDKSPHHLNRRSFLAFAVLAGCAPRATFLPAPEGSPGTARRIYVVTDRVVDSGFNVVDRRSNTQTHGFADVMIPPDHAPGLIEYNPRGPSAGTSFSVSEAMLFGDPNAFGARLAQDSGNEDEITLFVHGFNTRLSEAVYRHAQIAHDYQIGGPQITYSWSSADDPRGYGYDRDSIGIARDGLESLLINLARRQRQRIVLLGHSMGCQLVVETLRQMAIGGNTRYFQKLGPVVLISPDISIDLFERQLARITPRPDPFVVIVSQQDRALRLAARLTGQQARLGSTADVARLQALGIGVVDVSQFSSGRGSNHFLAATSPAAISLLRGLQAAGPDASWEQRQDIADIVFRPAVQ